MPKKHNSQHAVLTLAAFMTALLAVSGMQPASAPVMPQPAATYHPLLGQLAGADVSHHFASDNGAEMSLPAHTFHEVQCASGPDQWPLFAAPHRDDGQSRFWIYERQGDEPPYEGAFYVSTAQLRENGYYRTIHRLRSFAPRRTYVIMSEHDMTFTCGRGLAWPEEPLEGTVAVTTEVAITSVEPASPYAGRISVPAGQSVLGGFQFSAAPSSDTRLLRVQHLMVDIHPEHVMVEAYNEQGQPQVFVVNPAQPTAQAPCDVLYSNGTPISSTAFSGPALLECAHLARNIDAKLTPGRTVTLHVVGTVRSAHPQTEPTASVRMSLSQFTDSDREQFGVHGSHLFWQRITPGGNAEDHFWVDQADSMVHSKVVYAM